MDHPPEFLALVDEARKQIRELSPEEAALLIQAGALVIDVRDKDEFSGERIDGAVNISRGTLEMRISEVVPDKSTPVVCYCAGGNRGALATATLVKLGYKNAVSIAGGLKGYRATVKDD
jgi:rhodanese-related sulfurtransferase